MDAWKMINALSFERICGKPSEKEGAELIKKTCEEMGVKAHFETFELDTPEILEEKIIVNGKSYACRAWGMSGNTDANGITAPVVYIPEVCDELLFDVKGKIVLVPGMQAGDGRKKLIDAGVVGYINGFGRLYDEGEIVEEFPHYSIFSKKDDPHNTPAMMIHMKDFEEILRINPKEATIVCRQDMTKVGTGYNVVADIEGTDPSLKDEMIVLTAHMDTVEYSKGSWDNGSGCVTILYAMEHFVKNPPKRPIRFVFCGGEEVGLLGSLAYCRDHKDELDKVIYNINCDMIGALLSQRVAYITGDKSILDACLFKARSEGLHMKGVSVYPQSDSASFAFYNVPGITFMEGSVRNGPVIHCRLDVAERMDEAHFVEMADFIARYADDIANAKVNPIIRKIPEDIKKTEKDYMDRLGLDL